VIDERLAAAPGRLGDLLACLALGADEEHAPAARDGIAHGLQRRIERRHRLFQVNDMDAVSHAEDEGLHLRVPAAGVVAEMDAGFQKLAHGKGGHRHGRSVLSPV
jgi:hypothetical protein